MNKYEGLHVPKSIFRNRQTDPDYFTDKDRKLIYEVQYVVDVGL